MCETIDLSLGSLVDGEDHAGGLRCAVFGDHYFEVLIDKAGMFLRAKEGNVSFLCFCTTPDVYHQWTV